MKRLYKTPHIEIVEIEIEDAVLQESLSDEYLLESFDYGTAW